MYVWMTGGTMPRISATVAVLFVLLVSHGGALPVDDIFSLVLPPRGTPEASVARIRAIVATLGGHLQTAPGELSVVAVWQDGRRLQVVPTGQGTPNTTVFDLTCNHLEGGAKAMCEDIAQRYQTGR
jgi:hypothetical protein